MENVFENYDNQLWDEKELIIILNKDDMDIKKWKNRAKHSQNVSVFQLPEQATPGECQNFAVYKAKYHIIAKFDDDDYYSPYYLKGQIQAMNQTGAHIVGKRDCFYYMEGKRKLMITSFKKNSQNTNVDKVTDSSLMFRKEVFNTVQFSSDEVNYDSVFQRECVKKGFKIYSTDRYNYTVIRRADVNSHTWQISDREIKRFTEEVGKIEDYKSFVTKPL
ncbi:glycosyltransferase [Oceanobacillus piezotolerans]|nr:glycosyltransferase [Oceanobacillus piezotolerans]